MYTVRSIRTKRTTWNFKRNFHSMRWNDAEREMGNEQIFAIRIDSIEEVVGIRKCQTSIQMNGILVT